MTPFAEGISIDKTQAAEKMFIPLSDQEESSLSGMKRTLEPFLVAAHVDKHRFVLRNGSPPQMHHALVIIDERRGDLRSLKELKLEEPVKIQGALTVTERVLRHWRDTAGKSEALSPFGFYFIQSTNQVRYLPAAVCKGEWPESVGPFLNETVQANKTKRLSEAELCDNFGRVFFKLVHGEALPSKDFLGTINRVPDRRLRDTWKRLVSSEVTSLDDAVSLLKAALVHEKNPPRQELLPLSQAKSPRRRSLWLRILALLLLTGAVASAFGYRPVASWIKGLSALVKQEPAAPGKDAEPGDRDGKQDDQNSSEDNQRQNQGSEQNGEQPAVPPGEITAPAKIPLQWLVIYKPRRPDKPAGPEDEMKAPTLKTPGAILPGVQRSDENLPQVDEGKRVQVSTIPLKPEYEVWKFTGPEEEKAKAWIKEQLIRIAQTSEIDFIEQKGSWAIRNSPKYVAQISAELEKLQYDLVLPPGGTDAEKRL